jgi:hypothetical protein
MGFVMNDCKICENKIYYKNRLFIPENTGLEMQIIYKIYILILRRLTPSVHLLANSKGNHVTGKKPLAAA